MSAAARARRLRRRGRPRARPTSGPISKMLLETLAKQGLEPMVVEGEAFDPTLHEAVLHEPGDGRRERRHREPAHRLSLEGTRAASRHGQGQGLTGRAHRSARQNRRAAVGATARMVREGLLQDARRLRRARRRRTSPRPTASWPASCTPTPTPATRRPRSGSRRSRRPTTWSATRPSARSTTRSARSARWAAWAAGGSAAAPAAPAARRLHLQHRPTSTTCSAACSVAAVGGAAPAPARRAVPGPQRGDDLEAELHLVFLDAVNGRRDRRSTS